MQEPTDPYFGRLFDAEEHADGRAFAPSAAAEVAHLADGDAAAPLTWCPP
jgi:hypothetical protein